MNKLLATLCCIMSMILVVHSQERSYKHELKIGIGDPITYCWAHTPHYSQSSQNGEVIDKPISTGHIFAQYSYNINSWLSLGWNIDGIYAAQTTHKYTNSIDDDIWTTHHTVLSCIPTVRFTYYDRNIIRLYSSVGIGFSEEIIRSTQYQKYTPAAAFDVTALGISLGKNHWYGCFEIGGLTSFSSADYIILLGSKIFRLSIAYNF